MPTYEYRCDKCGVFEVFHGINQTMDKCPKCGAKVRRLISRNNNVIFKGSGFYSTDYRSGNHPKPAADNTANNSTANTGTANKTGAASSAATASPTDSKAS
ncbi:MAG: zinc ribbon domain-containing protein [Bacillota bacterium]|jgi:putative FmdB family regulatory protein